MEGQGWGAAGPGGRRERYAWGRGQAPGPVLGTGLRRPEGLIILRVGHYPETPSFGGYKGPIVLGLQKMSMTQAGHRSSFCALCVYVKHWLSVLHINTIFITTYEVGIIIIPILQLQKWKHRQVKQLA